MNVLLLTYRQSEEYIPLDLGYVSSFCHELKHLIDIKMWTDADKLKDMVIGYDYVFFFLDNMIDPQIFTLLPALRTEVTGIKYIHSYKINQEMSRKLLNSDVDVILRNEPEEMIYDMLKGRPLKHIDGISFKEKDRIFINQERKPLDLQNLPNPQRVLENRDLAYIMTCRNRSHDQISDPDKKRYHEIPLEHVKEQMDYLCSKGHKKYKILDEDFIGSRRGYEEMVQLFSGYHGCEFEVNIGIENLNKNNLKTLMKMKLSRIKLDVQSFNPRLGKKKTSLGMLERSMNLFRKSGTITEMQLTLGLKGDDILGFKRSIDRAIDLSPHKITVNRFFISPKHKIENYSYLKFWNSDPNTLLPFIASSDDFSKDEINRCIEYSKCNRRVEMPHHFRSRGSHVLIIPTTKCNLRCRHCMRRSFKNKNLSMNLAGPFIKEMKSFGVSHIILTGGEPTCYPHLTRLLDLIKKEGLRVSMVTNGQNGAGELPRYTEIFNSINVSIDSGESSTHDSIRGQGSFQKAISTIIELRNCNIFVVFRHVLSNENFTQVRKLFELAKKLDVGRIIFLALHETNKPFFRPLNFSYYEMKNILKRESARYPTVKWILRWGYIEEGRIVDFPEEMCATLSGGLDDMTLLPDGTVSLCCDLPDLDYGESRRENTIGKYAPGSLYNIIREKRTLLNKLKEHIKVQSKKNHYEYICTICKSFFQKGPAEK